MTKIKLKEICKYVNESVEVGSIKLENYVSTDNMLPNRAGITLSEKLPPQKMCKKFQKGDILVSNIRPYFKKIWFAEFDGGCSADVLVLKTVNPKFDPKFVYYNLFQDLFFKHQMAGAKGSKMPRGDKDQIMEFLIPKFDKNYQKNISDLLTVIDEKIQLNKKINTELENLAKTIYNYWFVQFDFPYDFEKNELCSHGPEDKKQNKCHCKPYKTSGGEMEWNEELKREIPNGWKVNLISKHFDYLEGPGITKDKYTTIGHKFINIKCIVDNDLDITEASMIKQDFIEQYSHFLLEENDIVVSTSGTLGRSAIVRKSHLPLLLNTSVIRFRPKNEDAFCFLYCYLKSERFLKTLRKEATGSIQKNFGPTHLDEMKDAFPSNNLIRQFEEIISPIIKKTLLLKEQNTELTKLRDFLLPLLMNGQVKVKSETKEQLSMAAEPQLKYGK